jgi:aminoglycoside phosphotransferase (APT) family kinase protein
MSHDTMSVAGAFRIPGPVTSAQPHPVGHINDSFIVTCKTDRGPRRFLLQRINDRIFKDPQAVMENIVRVTDHLRSKALDPEREALTIIPAVEGRPYHRDEAGAWWRMYLYIDYATSVETAAHPEQARWIARAFGLFQQRLADLDLPRLHETVPNFHNTVARLEALEKAIAADSAKRVSEAEGEIAFALARRDLAHVLVDMEARGALPERIVHNDTKINNVLLDEDTGLPLCVVDLDTVMPGLAVHDFGDLVRTATSPSAEDETDLEKVTMRLPIFEALARGYLETAGAFLSALEINQLVAAAQVITLETGIRFLTDFLQGDIYFKRGRERHNLDRCRAQFKLLESMERQEAEMHRAIRKML